MRTWKAIRIQKKGLALFLCLCAAILAVISSTLHAAGQAGRRSHSSNEGATVLNIVAVRQDKRSEPITGKQVSLYDNGVEQTIKSFSPDPSPARMVLLVDNSLTIRADVEKLEEATREFAYEIYEGDKLLIVGYDDQAEIVADWTDDAAGIEKALKSFRKKGDPHLFDALNAVAEEALRPLTGQKRVVVVISDGLDRGSKTKFNEALSKLQEMDITVYAVQASDRTRGAMRRDTPKPVQVIDQLANGTGGLVFPIDNARVAANSICDELRKNRYLLAYSASGIPFGDSRRLLVLGETGIMVRSKSAQPPN
ncbi:MAG: Ca-activated chloride channel [Blastocatellia bacterium]|jgi:VWFA-related protein|nr:Ca-activated chloride channel [Blastocatellia bacterium]